MAHCHRRGFCRGPACSLSGALDHPGRTPWLSALGRRGSPAGLRCYDCLQEARSDIIGIGVCSRCGLATCENHARVRQVMVTRQVGVGAASGRVPARRVVCHTCDLAETAH
ncbi:hypothetical protein SsS58_08514 [Streptomyces scabiei]|uniref:DUF2180 family protein n=1 Tax=Streptomyces scabiei TaxID=1930 RepID=A0A100JYL6_STRSC|nr:hypothetical protein SsS58_08514 [Streptomyces scabiei]